MDAGGATRWAVLVAMVAIAAFPASAQAVSAHVYVDPYCCFFPPTVVVQSSPGESTRLVVQANGNAGAVGASEVVITSAAEPIDANGLCTNAGPLVAVCTGAGTIPVAIFELYGGSNKVAFTPGSVRLYQVYRTGAGDDRISTGPFAGSPSHNGNPLSTFLGAGDDRIEFGPGPNADWFVLRLDEGDDTAIDRDSVPGIVDCGDGVDKLVSDGQNETWNCERQIQS